MKIGIRQFIVLIFSNILVFLFLIPGLTVNVRANGPAADEIAEGMLYYGDFKMGYLGSDKEKDSSFSEESLRAAATLIRPSCVQVRVGREVGSGSITAITSDYIEILTAAHVVKGMDGDDAGEKKFVIFYNGVVAVPEYAGISDDRDLAVLMVPTKAIEPYDLINLREVTFFEDADDDLSEKDSVVFSLKSGDVVDPDINQKYHIHGTGTDIAESYVYGTVMKKDVLVTDFGYNMLYVKCDAEHGMSGAGVFDMKGRYVGLLAGGSDNKEMVAVKLSDVMDLLMD